MVRWQFGTTLLLQLPFPLFHPPPLFQPATVPIAAAAIPHNVAGVSLHTAAVVLDADDGGAVIGIGIADQRLASASVDALEAEAIGPRWAAADCTSDAPIAQGRR